MRQITQLNQELQGLKPPEEIEKTQKEGVGMLKGMKNWAKENKMIAGLQKSVKDGIKFYEENPEQLVKLVISTAGIVMAGVIISPVIVANLVPGGTLAIAGKTIAGIGTYGIVGLQATGKAAIGLSVLSAAGSIGIGSKTGDMVAGGIKGIRNFLDNRNQTNQQSEMPPIQSNYDNNPNLAILSSNLPKTSIDISTIPFGQENTQNINSQPTQSPNQNQSLTTENPPLQSPQVEQNPKTNEKITEIKTLAEGLEKTKQPEFEKERLKTIKNIESSKKNIVLETSKKVCLNEEMKDLSKNLPVCQL